jgi:site-specific recombinase XerD
MLYVTGFREELARQGYRSTAATGQLQLMAHVSRWLASEGLAVGDLLPVRVEQFVQMRRSEGYTQRRSPHALTPLLEYLRRLGVVAGPSLLAATPLEELLDSYRKHLVDARGLAPSTVSHYVKVAEVFLSEHPGKLGELDIKGLSAGHVVEFVARQCRRLTPGSGKDLVTTLRSLLRFLHAAGLTSCELAWAVPTVAVWGGGSLPRALEPDHGAALLGSCDRGSVTGRRDLAVLTLLARLGLRAGEVAGLTLDDFDWRAGEVVVKGKGRRSERLPVPVDVGETVTGYQDGGRPRVECRSMFLRVCAPIVGIRRSGCRASWRARASAPVCL